MTFAVMVSIFHFSAETAAESSKTSEGLIVKIADTFVSSFEEKPIEEKEIIVSSLQDIVRKLAHYFIFFALGFSCAGFAFTFKNGKWYLKAALCTLFCMIYAVSDEIHQIYSPGRSFQFVDILNDSLGSLCGIFIIVLVVFLIYMRCLKNRK